MGSGFQTELHRKCPILVFEPSSVDVLPQNFCHFASQNFVAALLAGKRLHLR
jgi:hypothetical protein